ncbi:putative amidase At4g34880 [Silene latifolia]|uniref:putative amidase At4g34880 n=1 Tax=Silene latifolia TaxID=37657 RepID=UPI003D77E898
MFIITSYPSIHFLLKLITTILILLNPSPNNATHNTKPTPNFQIQESTIKDIQKAFKQNTLTSLQLLHFYVKQINKLNPTLRAVIEINPDASAQAKAADTRRAKGEARKSWVDGIPILIKDNIGTKDKMNTTAGSYALLGSIVGFDSGVVKRLRDNGAVILGKASLSEWANFRSNFAPSGWCARSGQGKNPYNLSATPCGSSSGSAIAAAANMAAVTLGTETDGSILCPSSANSVVGIKPTLGLTSRGGVVPISPRQDTVGPICRTVTDAAYVLESIVGYDPYDSEATMKATKYIPIGGYSQFLKLDGLKGKRLGILRKSFFDDVSPYLATVYNQHFRTLRQRGAVILDNLEIPTYDAMSSSNYEEMLLETEFKLALNSYLKQLVKSPVRSLADVIEFNRKHAHKEMIKEYGQGIFYSAEATKGIKSKEKKALATLASWSRDGFEKVMNEKRLDAIIGPGYSSFTSVLAIGGYPGISVPAGYDEDGAPFGIMFGGLKGSEPQLIEIAYAFEQATLVRKPPAF